VNPRITCSALVFALVTAEPTSAKELTTVELVRFARPSVVRIEVIGTVLETRDDKTVEIDTGVSGTGFIIDAAGYVLTNAHVVSATEGRWQAAPKIYITFAGLESIPQPGAVVGVDELSDLAVVKIALGAKDSPEMKILSDEKCTVDGRLIPLRFAQRPVEVGEDVVAIGFARGLDGAPTVTKGIVSAYPRSFLGGSVSDLIQMDAIINHGNSGGPLLNSKGEVVGVNTYGYPSAAWASSRGREHVLELDVTQGIFYARSSQTAGPFARMLMEHGRVRRADLGIRSLTLSRTDVMRHGLTTLGAIVIAVGKGTPATDAGLRVGDIIHSLAIIEKTDPEGELGKSWRILSEGDLHNALAFVTPGQSVRLLIRRPSRASIDSYAADGILSDADRGKAMMSSETRAVIVRTK
jgi:S1-C subfamily serine protease